MVTVHRIDQDYYCAISNSELCTGELCKGLSRSWTEEEQRERNEGYIRKDKEKKIGVFCLLTYRCGEPRSQGHLQVPLQSQQGRNQDEDLCDVLEGLPVLPARGRERRASESHRKAGYVRRK